MPNSSASPEGLATIAQQVHDYSGYAKPETRWPSDKAIRRYVIDNIGNLLDALDGNYKAAGEKEQALLMTSINGAKRKLGVIRDSLEAPSYLQGQFFLAGDVNGQRLERLYELEQGMLEETANIREELLSMKDGFTEEVIEDHFLHIGNFIDDLNQALFEREALIIGDA